MKNCKNKNINLVDYWFRNISVNNVISNYKKSLKIINNNIYSYNTLIGKKSLYNNIIIYDITAKNNNFISITTSKHVNMLKNISKNYKHFYNIIVV